jgi:hypothetical protein
MSEIISGKRFSIERYLILNGNPHFNSDLKIEDK